ncbi:hypothetical protein COLO4_27242 [Corchorus olitorius]|uniref:Uncharacterized protein n=1 Tax=Corchorus olitorius TaxID=93759 RepID=A0A1R3HRW1_9ROSI|nr:hypothetical protein COLO4_27242 [Corchorus olitorius]
MATDENTEILSQFEASEESEASQEPKASEEDLEEHASSPLPPIAITMKTTH